MSYTYQHFAPLFLGVPFDPKLEERCNRLIALMSETLVFKNQSASIETYLEQVKNEKFFAANPAYGNLCEYCVSLCEENGILSNNSKVNTAMVKVAVFFVLCFVPEGVGTSCLTNSVTVFSGRNIMVGGTASKQWEVIDMRESPKSLFDIAPPKTDDVILGVGSDGLVIFLEKYSVDARGKSSYAGLPLEGLHGAPREA